MSVYVSICDLYVYKMYISCFQKNWNVVFELSMYLCNYLWTRLFMKPKSNCCAKKSQRQKNVAHHTQILFAFTWEPTIKSTYTRCILRMNVVHTCNFTMCPSKRCIDVFICAASKTTKMYTYIYTHIHSNTFFSKTIYRYTVYALRWSVAARGRGTNSQDLLELENKNKKHNMNQTEAVKAKIASFYCIVS